MSTPFVFSGQVMVAILALTWTVAQSQSITGNSTGLLVKGLCPIVKLAKNFNTTSFAGSWYRVGGLPNYEERSVNCTIYNYVDTGSGFFVESTGVARNGDPTIQNKTLVTVTPGIARYSTHVRDIEAEMVVLGTDFVTYACLFTCYNFQGTHKVMFAWIFSRKSTLSRANIALCQKHFVAVGVPINNLRGTYQGPKCGHQ
ncbi:crustacyanin-A1 subunit-like [Homarus americanus]|uniref:Crustacyanin-A1 subunit-like 2 n=1 Tax=Homarus americanus TaxID=6706 RepID=A0A8J5J3X1_HOMAM|nr:crustacyanin-A1 subunit-like [Homarus americanus]KAG7153687.1 Crustacyanin-A1 subunit-like 2 [Homarus americanus]